MNRAVQFLKDCGTFYLATVDKDQPRVRPFGAVMEREGRVYICTNNTKDCFMQMTANPKVEICGMLEGTWIRICGEVAVDPSHDARAAMLEEVPSLKKRYAPDDGIYEVLYFTHGTVTINSFSEPPESFAL